MSESETSSERHDGRYPLECDLVMKGGITSGIVYPAVVRELAAAFRLRSVGGASAGAIAAAGAAAAQYRKAIDPAGRAGDPFAEFAGMAAELGEDGALRDLFAPQDGTRRAWEVLAPLMLARGWLCKIASLVSAPVATLLVSILVLFGIARVVNPALPAVEIALALVIVVPLVFLVPVVEALREVPRHGMGLCSGMGNRERSDRLPLTPWLHAKLQSLAGLDAKDPLTFGHLWGLPTPPDREGGDRRALAGPPPSETTGAYLALRRAQALGRAPRDIVLELITTDLTYGRPHRLPLDEQLFFRREELAPLFPPEVVAALVERATPWDPEWGAQDGFLALPPAWDLPVIVAVRLSLSFPLLVTVVPLHRRVLSRLKGATRYKFVRCWFSDGGILSNFPIHLFDQLLPTRPTFGIHLRSGEADECSASLPEVDDPADLEDRRTGFGDNDPPGFVSFGAAMLTSLREWQDNSQMRLPGFRDRIVHISLRKGLGGLNLNMNGDEVAALMDVGQQAGALLRDAFGAMEEPAVDETRWEAQRRMRYRCAATMLERVTTRMSVVEDAYRGLMANELASAENLRCWTGQPQIDSADKLISALCREGQRLERVTTDGERLDDGVPTPRQRLRISTEQHG